MKLQSYENLIDIRNQQKIREELKKSTAKRFQHDFLTITSKYIGLDGTRLDVIQKIKDEFTQLLMDYGEDPGQLSFTVHFEPNPNTVYITADDDLTFNVFKSYGV